MKLSFYGADQCVTGSCHCLEVNGKKFLSTAVYSRAETRWITAHCPSIPAALIMCW